MSFCPPIEQLGALIRGELGEPESGVIEGHLEECDHCRGRVNALSEWAFVAPVSILIPREGMGARSRELLDRLAQNRSATGADSQDFGERFARGGTPRHELPPELPGYRLTAEVGRGGMGTVYRALQSELGRPVALKVLSAGRMAGPGARERFRREVRALALLRHPNVVRIHDVGEHDGLPFLVMEWIEGGDLARLLRDGPLPVRQAAEIALPLARAVQAAHDQGIIHRDLKPGNVLLSTEADDSSGAPGRPTPKVSDFGLAKLVDDDDGTLTESGAMVGTPGYMAPEQTGLLRSAPQGPATDVYGLGAILYEMLVGRPPFGGSSRAETIRQIVAADIVPPRRLRPDVPRDMDTICLKCLEREPGRRYATARALAEELERYLEGRPIEARPAGGWERAVRWCRRKPAEARLVLVLVAVVLASFASVTWLWRRADAEAIRARRAAAAESRLRTDAQAEVAMQNLDKGIALAQAGAVDQGLLWMADSIKKAPENRLEFLRVARANMAAWGDCAIKLRTILEHQGGISRARYCDDGRAILTGSRDGTARFWDAATGRPLRPPIRHGDQITSVEISPDRRLVATQGTDGRARLWEAETGRPIGPNLLHGESVASIEFAPDGRRLATQSLDRTVQLRDIATGRPVGPPLKPGPVRGFWFTADGRSIVTHGEDRVVRSFDTTDGRPDGPELRCDWPITRALVGPNPRWIAIEHADGVARVWDRATGQAVGSAIHDGQLLAFSPDGRRLLAAGPRGRARLWDPAAGRELGPIMPHPPFITCAAFSPDGRIVLTAGRDHTTRLWDAATGRLQSAISRHRLPVVNVEFAPDGRSFLTSSEDGTVVIWDFESLAPTPIGPDPASSEAEDRPTIPRRARGVTFDGAVVGSDRDRVLLRSQSGGLVRLVETRDGQPIGAPLLHCWPNVGYAAISPAGDRFATSNFDDPGSRTGSTASICQIFDTATGRATAPVLPHMNWPARLAFSPDGKALATGGFDTQVHLWEVATGRPMGPPLAAGSIVQSLAFSPDGRLLAAGTAEIINQVLLWDLSSRMPRGEPISFKNWVHKLAFSPDSSRLAVGSRDTTAQLIDTATGRPIAEPLRHAEAVNAVVFSPDGRTLLTATRGAPEKSIVRSWSAGDGRPGPGSISLPAFIAQDMAFAPDGILFAAGCEDGSISVWDVATMRQVGPTRVLRGRILALAFSPDGASLMAADAGGHVVVWSVPRPAPEPIGWLVRHAGARTGMELDPAGHVGVVDAAAWRRLGSQEENAGQSIDPFRTLEWHDACARDAEAAGDSFAARWHLDRLIAGRPGDGLLHARRAVARLRESSGDTALARSDLDRALALGPRDRVVDWLAHRAEDLRASGAAKSALLLIDRAVAARPDDWRVHALRAESLAALGRRADCDAAQARAVELGADIPVLMKFAEERARAGRYHESALLFDRAIARGEVPYEVWEWSALTHLAIGDDDGYRRTCAALRSRYPASLPTPLVAWELARVCTLGPGGLGDDGKAPAWATGSVRLVGEVAYRSGRFHEAVDSLRRVIAKADGPVLPEDAAFLAMALFHSGDRPGSLAILARCPPPRDSAGGIVNRQQQAADQLRHEAERLIFGDPLPRDVFAR